jgi:hypothetical protein
MKSEKIGEGREILEGFAVALGKVKVKEKKLKKAAGGFREEGNGSGTNEEFRKRMFANAPRKDGECIVAERKEW